MAKNVHRNINNFIKNCELITNNNWQSVTKTRYVHDATNHMFFRVDLEPDLPRFNKKIDYSKYDIIVVSDYNKGFLTEEDIQKICESHPRVFLDTKKKLGPWAANAHIIKINDYEYKSSDPSETAALSDKIIHTMGANGCEFDGKHYPVDPVEVKDSSGAGDAFLAALIIKYSETKDIDQSIVYANECASDVVTHRGVTSL
jgi:sugar/nucleoside kinase (ribokinase family)